MYVYIYIRKIESTNQLCIEKSKRLVLKTSQLHLNGMADPVGYADLLSSEWIEISMEYLEDHHIFHGKLIINWNILMGRSSRNINSLLGGPLSIVIIPFSKWLVMEYSLWDI